MKTISLPLSKKLAALNLGVESEYYWASFDPKGENDWRGPYIVDGKDENDIWLRYPEGGQYTFRKNFDCDATVPAYTLPELLPVLKALGEKKGWPKSFVGSTLDKKAVASWKEHFAEVCRLYAQSESLEGAEEYILKLIES